MRVHRLSFTAGELGGQQLRVPVRRGNSNPPADEAEWARLEFDGARSRHVEGCWDIRVRQRHGRTWRVVSVTPRYGIGHVLVVTVPGQRKLVRLRVTHVSGRRVRDATPADGFHSVHWVNRHGRRAYERNPWCWCLTVAPEVT